VLRGTAKGVATPGGEGEELADHGLKAEEVERDDLAPQAVLGYGVRSRVGSTSHEERVVCTVLLPGRLARSTCRVRSMKSPQQSPYLNLLLSLCPRLEGGV
jgi:hypothetical protein